MKNATTVMIFAVFTLITTNVFADGGPTIQNPQKIGDWWHFDYQDSKYFSKPDDFYGPIPSLAYRYSQSTFLDNEDFYSVSTVNKCTQTSMNSPAGNFKNCEGIENVQGATYFDFSFGPKSKITDVNFEFLAAKSSAYDKWAIANGQTRASAYTLTIYAQGPEKSLECISSIGSVSYGGRYSTGSLATNGDILRITYTHPISAAAALITAKVHCNKQLYIAHMETAYSYDYSKGLNFILLKSLALGSSPEIKLSVKQYNSTGSTLSTKTATIEDEDRFTVPLGSITSLSLAEGSNQISASYKLISDSKLFIPSLSASSIKNGLYTDRVAILFAEGKTNSSQLLMPVHLGTQFIQVTPSNSKYAPFKIKVKVVAPTAVGTGKYDCTFSQNGKTIDTEYSDCDTLIVETAHNTGIPPQYIKAQI